MALVTADDVQVRLGRDLTVSQRAQVDAWLTDLEALAEARAEVQRLDREVASIRTTVAEVQDSATRIRRAMEAQAQTVTAITAAVDETALAADSMSFTVATIVSPIPAKRDRTSAV